MKDVRFLNTANWQEKHPLWCPIDSISVHHATSNRSTNNHYHKGHEYYIVTKGNADIIIENQRFKLSAGEVAAIYKEDRHHLENESDDFSYVSLRESSPEGAPTPFILDNTKREFIGYQGRYADGPVKDNEVPIGHSAVLQTRAWFWLKMKPWWSFMTSMGGITYQDGDNEPDYHKHECFEIYLCVAGHLTAYVDGKYYEMHEGDIVTIPTGIYHRVYNSHGESQLAYFYGSLEGLKRYGHLDDTRDEWVLD